VNPKLGWVMVVIFLSAAARTTASPGNPSSCPATLGASAHTLQQVYAELKRSLESSPLARYLGRPVSCAVRVDDGAIRLTYESPTGARLETHRDPTIELTEQRLSEKGLSRPTVLALLQRTERWAFGDKGCGIAWNASPTSEVGPAPGRRGLVYGGGGCNCQARLEYDDGALTEAVFRSAC
jgi:hypothetical protein